MAEMPNQRPNPSDPPPQLPPQGEVPFANYAGQPLPPGQVPPQGYPPPGYAPPPPGYAPPGYAPPGYPPGYPPPGYMMPPGYPPIGYMGPQSTMTPQQAAKARSLVSLSNWLGWGGIGLMFLGSPVIGVAAKSGVAAAVVAGIGVVMAIVGAIVGQVGRGMQGRVV